MANQTPYVECWRCKVELAHSETNLYVCPICNAKFYIVPVQERK